MINTCHNFVKVCLALEIRNVSDWPRFGVLKAFVFLVYIHFLDLVFFGLYDFFVLALFHLNSLSKFFLPPYSGFSLSGWPIHAKAVFNIEIRGAISLLNPWMNY